MREFRPGTCVVSKPEYDWLARQGVVATVDLYGPRGGHISRVSITKANAQETVSRLTAYLDEAIR